MAAVANLCTLDPRGKGLLIRDISHALRRHRDLVSPLGEGIREVENVALLAADVRRKKLGQQKDAHQCVPDGTVEPLAVTRSRAR